MNSTTLFPAEWYPQSGIQLTWPHEATDWAYMLDEVTACYIDLAREIAKREHLLIVTPHPEQVKQLLQGVVDPDAVTFAECPTNDTWARDHGGITLLRNGEPCIYDFKFNGWGLKFAANYDNLITSTLYRQNRFRARYENRLNFVVEGGALESDGAGTLLGGLYGAVCEYVLARGYDIKVEGIGIPDRFISQARQTRQLADCGIDYEGIKKSLSKYL